MPSDPTTTAGSAGQDHIPDTAAFGGPDAGLPLDADGKWHGVIDDPGLVTEPATAATDDELCPECEWGVVVEVGPQCRETGHVPLACSKSCGWSS